jgi:hypothetical protein
VSGIGGTLTQAATQLRHYQESTQAHLANPTCVRHRHRRGHAGDHREHPRVRRRAPARTSAQHPGPLRRPEHPHHQGVMFRTVRSGEGA